MTYICAACRGEFEEPEGRDAEAHREALENYNRDGNHPTMVKVCCDCFRKIRRIEESIALARSARWN